MSGLGAAKTPITIQEGLVNQPVKVPGKEEEAIAPDAVLSDSDSDAEDDSGPRPRHVTERRRVQNSIFSAW